MSTTIRELEPKEVWNRFADINAVPRPSKKEQKITAFMVDFGKKLGLETTSDAYGNVIIRKPATAGLEHKKPIILQSHLDMVCQKNNDTVFDFDNQGIETYIDGDWVRAKGTTLGADNGMGVAAIMAILESKTIAHPALEALFTTDEETGMTGAQKLSNDALKGEILLNLDTELDTEIEIGCAGGIDVSAYADYKEEATPSDVVAYHIVVTGLLGGHSGMEIHIGRGNANKIMNRVLFHQYEKHGLRLAQSLAAAFELAGYKVEFTGAYPGWEPNPHSPILQVLKKIYVRLFQEEPNVAAIHAGLECGLLGEHFPHIDMISFGPTILGAHSPNERVSIKSVQKFWKYLLEILKNTPE